MYIVMVSLCMPLTRQSVAEYQKTSETKYASAESSAREWAEVSARAEMHKGKWSQYWEEAKAAGDTGNQKVCAAFSKHTCATQMQGIDKLCYAPPTIGVGNS